jgi:hypothetical protein
VRKTSASPAAVAEDAGETAAGAAAIVVAVVGAIAADAVESVADAAGANEAKIWQIGKQVDKTDEGDFIRLCFSANLYLHFFTSH